MTYVSVDGPYPNADQWSDWEEYPEWTVCLCDEDGEPYGKIYRTRSYAAAFELGRKMARDRRLELVDDACQWA